MPAVRYRQCVLYKQSLQPCGVRRMTTWLPEKFAVKDLVVKLKGDDGEWEDGWRVVSVSEAVATDPPDYRKAIRGHRVHTGDSLPKQK